jgi:hypothetical protein
MREGHWHNDLVFVASATLAVVIGLHLTRLSLGWVNKHSDWPSPVLTLSRAGVALVTFN